MFNFWHLYQSVLVKVSVDCLQPRLTVALTSEVD